MYNSLDAKRILSILNIQGITGLVPYIIIVIWQPPPSHWIKANTDGSSSGSPGIAGSRGIFKTASGFPRGAFAFGNGSSYTFIAELSDAIYVVEVAWSKGWLYLWLESDSMFVVNAFASKTKHMPWVLLDRWFMCLHYLSQMHFRVTHIYREGNSVANLLAKHGSMISSFCWWDSAPSFCNDFCRQPSYRFC